MYREQEIVPACVSAVAAAADACGVRCEMIIADDASPDATLAALQQAATGESRLRVVALPANRGQLGATRAALAVASATWVVVLDGDLQDPPELIPALWQRAQRGDVDAVFAVKTRRDDPAWVRLGALGYRVLLRLGGGAAPPSGGGSFVLMRLAMAGAIADFEAGRANVGPLVAALTDRVGTVPYVKAARYDGASRVGPAGLVAEAWNSLIWSGALQRLCFVMGALGLSSAAALASGAIAVDASWQARLLTASLVACVLAAAGLVRTRAAARAMASLRERADGLARGP